MMQTWEVLERAADKIERDGWWRGKEVVNKANDCPVTACGKVCDDQNTRFAVYNALKVALGARRSDSLERVTDWNDAPGRTAAEVIAMLRAVAASEKARAARLLPVVREQVPA